MSQQNIDDKPAGQAKRRRPPKVRRAAVPAGPAIDHAYLTNRDAGMIIKDGDRKIGCTIGLANGKWAAWDLTRKIGEYATQAEAAAAVWKEHKRKKAKRSETPS